MAYDQRKSAPTFQKNDEYDAFCVATVLINQLNLLPDAKPEDDHWTLAQLVNRRDGLVSDGIRLKNVLHEQLTTPYPSYRKFFSEVDLKTAMYFWETYPSPVYLQNKSVDDLTMELKEIAPNFARNKVELILDCVQNDGDTIRDYQEKRDFITWSLVRDLEHQIEEIEQVNAEIEKMLKCFDYKLNTMPGIGTVIASK